MVISEAWRDYMLTCLAILEILNASDIMQPLYQMFPGTANKKYYGLMRRVLRSVP